MSKNKLLTAALRYAELGYPVFPCGGDKKPLTKSGFKDASVDPKQVRAWWAKWPEACIGIATAGMVVIDRDVLDDGSANPWPDDRRYASDLADAPTSCTPRGGRHHIFRRPDVVKWRCSTSKLALKVDTRTNGGYIVAPPSVAPAGEYQWADGITLDAPLTELPEVPAWLARELDRIHERAPKAIASVPAPASPEAGDDVTTVHRAERYLDAMPPAIQGSNGSGACYAAATAMVNGFALSERVALDLLSRRYNPRCVPEWSEKELAHKVRDAATKEHDRPRGYLRNESSPVELANGVYSPADANGAKTPPAPGNGVKPKRRMVDPYSPFPTGSLPEPLRGFVETAAAAMGCDASYAALPLLAAVASAIGTTRRLRLKRGWTVPSIIWAVTVGESGTLKTPPFKLALRAIRERQERAMEGNAKAHRGYVEEMAYYEKAMIAWKKSKDARELPPEKPEPPPAVRYAVSDTTVEALAPILLDNPRGLLLARDELAGWFGSFDKYSGNKGGGADASHWLSMHNGEAITVDRKTGIPRTIYVPEAAVSVTGGIQPGILRRALGQEHRESGLAARLLMACPPRRAKRWTEADIPERVERNIARLLDRLHELEHVIDENERARPGAVELTTEAKEMWVAYYNAHGKEQADMAGDMAAAWSKLEEYAARFALVIHFVRWAAFDTTLADEWKVDAVSMRTGIELVEWFKRETRRVYAMLGEDDEERDNRRLAEWIDGKGGSVTAREVAQGCRWLREAGMAEAALEELRKAGWGEWVVEPTATNQRRVFRLTAVSTSTDSPETRTGGESVDVDSVDAPDIEPEVAVGDDDEWGEL